MTFSNLFILSYFIVFFSGLGLPGTSFDIPEVYGSRVGKMKLLIASAIVGCSMAASGTLRAQDPPPMWPPDGRVKQI